MLCDVHEGHRAFEERIRQVEETYLLDELTGCVRRSILLHLVLAISYNYHL